MIPSSQVSAEEIMVAWENAKKVIDKWTLIKTSTSSLDFADYRDQVAEARELLNRIQDFIDTNILEWRTKRVPIAGKLEELDSLDHRAKDFFFRIREQEREANA